MTYYKTLRIGCDPGPPCPVGDTVIFDNVNILSYFNLLTTLSALFWKTSFEYQQKLRTYPQHVRIYVASNHFPGLRTNPSHKNTTIETLEWLLNNFTPPLGGMVVSIFSYDNLYPGLDNPCPSWAIWPLKQRWIGDGDYVTLERIGPKSSPKKIQASKEIGHWDLIQNIEKYCPYPVKEIGYGNEEASVDALIHSKRHFSYHGGSYALAALVDAPTVTYGSPMMPGPSRGSIFDMKTTYEDRKMQKKAIVYQKGLYQSGSMHGSPARVYHYDIERKMCLQKPQTFARHAWNAEELLGYITFTEDLIIEGRDRQDWVNLTDLPSY